MASNKKTPKTPKAPAPKPTPKGTPKPRKGQPPWGEEQNVVIQELCQAHMESGGEMGLDSVRALDDKDFIVEHLKHHPIVGEYASRNNGGHPTNDKDTKLYRK